MKTISIGRAPENNIIIQDALVSSRHLQITKDEAGRFWVEDLNSTNGTWVGKVLVRGDRLAIDFNTILKIGDTVLVWQNYFQDSPVQEALSEPSVPPTLPTHEDLPELSLSATLPARNRSAGLLPILRWTALGMSVFFLFLLLFWYFSYVQRP